MCQESHFHTQFTPFLLHFSFLTFLQLKKDEETPSIHSFTNLYRLRDSIQILYKCKQLTFLFCFSLFHSCLSCNKKSRNFDILIVSSIRYSKSKRGKLRSHFDPPDDVTPNMVNELEEHLQQSSQSPETFGV